MSKLQELIDKLCPDGVEYFLVNYVADIKKGTQLNKTELLDEGVYPAYNGGVTYSGFASKFNVSKNTTIISQGGASAGFVQYINTDFWANAHCYYAIPKQNIDAIVKSKYLFYFLKQNQKHLMEHQHGAGIPALNAKKIYDLKIPVPAIEVQEEIVRILDNFTELTAELTARKKQYEYYRNSLLDFSDEMKIEYREIGEYINYIQPTEYIVKSTDYSDAFKIPVLTAGQSFILGYTNENKGVYLSNKNNPIILFDDFTTSNHWVDFNFKVKSSALKILVPNMKKQMNFRYFFYCIQNIKFDKGEHGRKWISIFSKIKIPVPSLPIQNEIVRVLDKFSEYAVDVSGLLPEEIKLRQKQYEYYREKLLTFNDICGNTHTHTHTHILNK